jgi:Trk K+ transport system NAD-binding subunit
MDSGRLFGGFGGRGEGPKRRRVLLYLVVIVSVVAFFTVIYRVAMISFENQFVTFPEALLAVIQSFTTTGYGEQADLWTTSEMQLLMVAMEVTGVALIFLALPVFIAPWIEERLTTRAPTAIELSGHVVICGFTSRGEALVDELDSRDIPHVIIEPDFDLANELFAENDHLTVIHGDPEDEASLRDAGAHRARAIVADVDQETNASIALAARSLDCATVITFVEDPAIADYHRLAGATEVFSPRQLIGRSIARKVTASVTPDVDGVAIDEDFDIVELPVQADSELAGRTVAESGIRERFGTNIVGAWFRGEFVTPPPPNARIDQQTILVVAGREDQLEQLKNLTRSERHRHRKGRVIICGYGEVGSTVAASLGETETTVVDLRDLPEVDVVGDIMEVETLERAGIGAASTVILALADDTDTVFATLVARDLNPDIEIIARADATGSVPKLYRAGADYVLALATVAGRMLASTILEEDVISFDRQVEVIRIGAGNLVGKTLAEADIRARTGVTVIAVERDDLVITDLPAVFRLQHGDDLIVTGSDGDINEFAALVET